jgi:predicted phage terminase large subunit-like protein
MTATRSRSKPSAKPKVIQLPGEVVQNTLVSLARRSFYAYCRVAVPAVYLPHRRHLVELCETLQAFIEDRLLGPDGQPVRKLMINLPPRHGKTLTVQNLCRWMLGHDPTESVITVSYNETLSGRMAKAVRDGIQEIKADPRRIVFSDVFAGVRVKDGDGGYQLWSLEGSHFSYLATSPGATITGIGARLGVIDDLVKNASEAFNERVLDEQWEWYVNTFLSRLEAGSKQLVIMTRWATRDLCGRLLALEPDAWHVIKMPAWDGEKMLAPDVLSREEYLDRQTKTDPVVFAGNYDQEPFDSQDSIYPELKTYTADSLPVGGAVECYTDTADEGDDYLAGAVYLVHRNTAYVLDVLYTQDAMESTEVALAKMLTQHRCQLANIESNNGGRGFARNVERIMRESFGYSGCKVNWFHQSENKRARILSNSTSVVNSVIFPVGWENRWPLLYQHLRTMGRLSKWKRDDCADMLTGIVEKSLGKREKLPTVVPLPTANRW